MAVMERVKARPRQVAPRKSLAPHRERLKRDLVDGLGLTNVATLAQGADVGEARNEIRIACQSILNTGGYDGLAAEDREVVVGQVLDEVCGLGPLQPLLDDPSITEVMVNGPEGLFFERDGELHPAERVFESAEQIMLVVDRILAPLGRRLDAASPIVNARLANGDRVNAVAAPVAVNGPAVTIRKFSRRMITLDDLVRMESVPPWYAQLLSWAVRARKAMAVAGGTGSGKTTLLNALSCEIDKRERIVTIEDSAELRFETHPNVVSLEARDASLEGTGQITIRDLVKNALRMRPDRIVVGEVRSGEAIDMLQAMNTGHSGSLTTLHAGGAHEAIARLVLMARMGMDLPADLIEQQVATALDFVVMSCRLADGSRYLSSLTAVDKTERGKVDLRECVHFDVPSRTWQLVQEPPFVSACLREGTLSHEEVEQWRSCCA